MTADKKTEDLGFETSELAWELYNPVIKADLALVQQKIAALPPAKPNHLETDKGAQQRLGILIGAFKLALKNITEPKVQVTHDHWKIGLFIQSALTKDFPDAMLAYINSLQRNKERKRNPKSLSFNAIPKEITSTLPENFHPLYATWHAYFITYKMAVSQTAFNELTKYYRSLGWGRELNKDNLRAQIAAVSPDMAAALEAAPEVRVTAVLSDFTASLAEGHKIDEARLEAQKVFNILESDEVQALTNFPGVLNSLVSHYLFFPTPESKQTAESAEKPKVPEERLKEPADSSNFSCSVQ
jgi:hypothetical protein